MSSREIDTIPLSFRMRTLLAVSWSSRRLPLNRISPVPDSTEIVMCERMPSVTVSPYFPEKS
jgi:hypothetical protein